MRWTITIEGTGEFGAAHRSEIALEKDLNSLTAGAVGFSIEDGKAIMAQLQQVIVKQQCETYVLSRRFCMDCERFRRVKDYGKRNIRTVFGCVEVSNPRILNCQRCLPHFRDASAVLRDICPDQATPELMELSARLGSLMPYRKAADVLADFLPIKSTESFVTVRHRTLNLGKRLDEKARDRAWFDPPEANERGQIELDLPNDPKREFVVSIDTAHVRGASEADGRTFEIAVARCGRGQRGSRPGHYFVTADTSNQGLRLRTLQALQREGYTGCGELSDGAEIMKRLPRGLPRPTRHIVDWFHIAMKVQPLQQVADHIVRWRDEWTNGTVILDEEIRALKWKLWHGQVDRAIQQLEELIANMAPVREQRDLEYRTHVATGPTSSDLHPSKQGRDGRLRSSISIRPPDQHCARRVCGEFGDCPPHGQKAADAMVKTRRSFDAASARRSHKRRLARAVVLPTTNIQIAIGLDVQTDAATPQSSVAPQLI